MNEQKFNALISYLEMLFKLNGNDYQCHKEIAECVEKIRVELGFKN